MNTRIEIGSWAATIAKTVAAAAMIGGGTVVLDAQRDNAVQDTLIASHEKRLDKSERLTEKLTEVSTKVDILLDRLDRDERNRGN
jgi:hypothetical protein